MDNNNLVRFLLTFFLGWIGSLIINHTSLKPEGYTSRTGGYIIWGCLTCDLHSRCFHLQPVLRSHQGKKHRLQERLIIPAYLKGVRDAGAFLPQLIAKIVGRVKQRRGFLYILEKCATVVKKAFTKENKCSIIQAQPTPVNIISLRNSHIFKEMGY